MLIIYRKDLIIRYIHIFPDISGHPSANLFQNSLLSKHFHRVSALTSFKILIMNREVQEHILIVMNF